MYELYLHDFCLDFDENEDEAIEGDNIEDEPGSNEPFVDSPDINPELLGYRCAAHTLQLAILDALKNVSTRTLLELARRVCKCLKNQNMCPFEILSKKILFWIAKLGGAHPVT